jgi:hypothetical protein
MKYLKKLSIIATIAFGLSSCSEAGYPIKSSPDSMTSQFINLEKVAEDNSFGETASIFRDTHTDVLYFVFVTGYKGGITPIAEPDGTFLTYSEWKGRN